MTDCLFCRMVGGAIKPDIVFENDHILAFNDISPQAPVHVLVIPKIHIATLNDLNDTRLGGEMLEVTASLATQLGIAADGYRTVFNCNTHGGQTVQHLHLHLLGGRQMFWPPG